jgi:hypothetical protein
MRPHREGQRELAAQATRGTARRAPRTAAADIICIEHELALSAFDI